MALGGPPFMEWTEKTQYERIVECWSEQDNVQARLKTAREDISDYFRPDLGVDYDESHDMLMLGGEIYEGSGPWVARRATTAFQGNTVSKKLDWIKYGFSDKRLAGIDELDAFAQDLKTHNSAVYQNGNFYDIQPQFTLDGWTIGSPLIFIEEDPDTNHVMCIPSHWLTYRLFYDKFNHTEGVIIKEEWSAKRCFDEFCTDKDITKRLAKAEKIFTQGLYDAIKNGRMNTRFHIWRAVFKSTDPIFSGLKAPVSSKYYPKKWYGVYFEDGCLKEKQNEPLGTQGYYSKPFVNWDYNKKLWETASRTPAFEAIFDNKGLQKIFKAYVDSAQDRVRPAMAALLDMEDRLDFRSQGVTYFKPNEWQYIPQPINQAGEVTLELDIIKVFKENLNRHFSLDTFQLFTELAHDTNQEMKVFQLVEMAGEKITQLLPTIESHEYYLAEVDARVQDIERQAGRGPYNPREIENIIDILDFYLGDEASGVRILPEFIGTLRQTQQMQQKLKPIQYGMGALSELGVSMQDENYVRHMIKRFETGEAIIEAVNFPQKLVNEKAEYERLEAEFQELQARREQFANQIEMAKALPPGTIEQLTGQTA